MIVAPSITTYLHSLQKDHAPFLEDLRLYAKENDVPIIRREVEPFLLQMLTLSASARVLEIGTGIAYSAVLMASSVEGLRRIDTMENYPPRIEKAKEVLHEFAQMQEYASAAQIHLIEGDAAENIQALTGAYDFIFLDGPKAQYIHMLPHLLRLLNKGGILFSDNVLQEGDLVQSRYITPRRDRTIHERMRSFLWEITHHPQLCTSVLTIGDGVALSVKR